MVAGSNKQPLSLVINVSSKAKGCSGSKGLLNR